MVWPNPFSTSFREAPWSWRSAPPTRNSNPPSVFWSPCLGQKWICFNEICTIWLYRSAWKWVYPKNTLNVLWKPFSGTKLHESCLWLDSYPCAKAEWLKWLRKWRFVKMFVPGFVDKSQFHACRLTFAFKKYDLPWWRKNVEILRYLWKSF